MLWVRPLQSIVALFDGKVLAGEIALGGQMAPIKFGDTTRGHRFLRSELAVDVGQGDGGLNGADVHSDDDALVIQPQEGGASPARKAAGRSFEHPTLLNQFLDG